MRVVLKQSGTQSYVLVGGINAADCEEELRISHQRKIQDGEFLRSRTARAFWRGNHKTTISWSGTKEHNTFRLAEEFLMEHAAAIPETGDLLFIAEGEGEKVYTLSHAKLQTHESKRIGLTTMHTYTFVGGDFSEGSL